MFIKTYAFIVLHRWKRSLFQYIQIREMYINWQWNICFMFSKMYPHCK